MLREKFVGLGSLANKKVAAPNPSPSQPIIPYNCLHPYFWMMIMLNEDIAMPILFALCRIELAKPRRFFGK